MLLSAGSTPRPAHGSVGAAASQPEGDTTTPIQQQKQQVSGAQDDPAVSPVMQTILWHMYRHGQVMSAVLSLPGMRLHSHVSSSRMKHALLKLNISLAGTETQHALLLRLCHDCYAQGFSTSPSFTYGNRLLVDNHCLYWQSTQAPPVKHFHVTHGTTYLPTQLVPNVPTSGSSELLSSHSATRVPRLPCA